MLHTIPDKVRKYVQLHSVEFGLWLEKLEIEIFLIMQTECLSEPKICFRLHFDPEEIVNKNARIPMNHIAQLLNAYVRITNHNICHHLVKANL